MLAIFLSGRINRLRWLAKVSLIFPAEDSEGAAEKEDEFHF